jgi:glutamyl-tRNA(Gln) amidotransferase subunit D (EC 6.3.5.7)
MPRYEHSDDKHIVLKLKSGYNIGLEIEKIEKIEKNPSIKKSIEKNQELEKNENLPNIYYYQLEVQLQVKLITEQVLLHQY